MVPKRVSPYFDKMEVDNTLVKAELYVVILKISMYIYLGNFKNAFLDYVCA